VNKNLRECQKLADRFAANPTVGLHAYHLARRILAVRVGQRALGIPEDQIFSWPVSFQQLFTQLTHPDLKRLIQEDMVPLSDTAPAKGQQQEKLAHPLQIVSPSQPVQNVVTPAIQPQQEPVVFTPVAPQPS